MFRFLTICLVVSGVSSWSQVTAKPGKRAAFLVGLTEYAKLPAIPHSGPNLQTMRAALAASGFETIATVANCTMSEFQTARDRFLSDLQPGDSVVVYFSGYGVAAIDEYYLLPRDFDAKKEISDQAILLSTLVQNIELRTPALAIVMLETAFRADSLARLTDPNPAISEPRLTAVWFADQWTAAGTVPASSEVSAFTREVTQSMAKEGSTPPGILDDVKRVLSAGNQSPRSLGMNGSGFFFRPPVPVVTTPPISAVREPGKDELRPNRTDRQEYVWIPPGAFNMGCVAPDNRCQNEEQPQHAVTITQGFWLGRTEVEITAYQRYVESDKSSRKMPGGPLWDPKWKATNHPITGVSWLEANNYCQWVGGRLPTEAEWEYAARAGAPNEIYPLNDENSRDKANFSGKKQNDRFEYTAPVRSFDANKFGLFDLAGNVWEWTQDWFDADFYKSSPPHDPIGPQTGKGHSVRGGSFDSDPREHLRLSYRKGLTKGGNNVGFRCVLENSAAVRKLLF